jgi:5,10-methylenetetrahydrofolate reductase
MVHGPCGGVHDDGTCEAGPQPCAFIGLGAQDVPGVPPRAGTAVGGHVLTPAARELLALAARRPIVVADVPTPPGSADGQRMSAGALAGAVDAGLLGDSPAARVHLPPTLRAALVAGEGLRAWAGLTCRDRNRVALEGELAGLVAVGAAGVHCITGDHQTLGHRPDAQGVFDLDSTRLAMLAADSGLAVSVAESPAAPPLLERPGRLAAKVRAGARVCFVNHAGGPEAVGAFVAAARALGAQDVLFLACVPVATTARGLDELAHFTRGRVPAGASSALTSSDPTTAAIRVAVEEGEAMLGVDGIGGVDLSGACGPGEELAMAAALAEVGAALGGGS